MHDQRSRCDRAEQRRRERHVVVTCGKRSCHIIKLQDLLVTMDMATPQHVAFGIGHALKGFSRELRGRSAERLRKIRRCTYENHGCDSIGLHCGDVKQSFCAHAHADGLGPRDSKMVEQRQDIPPTLAECEALGGIRGPPVPAQIRHYDAIAVRISGKDVAPIVADTHASVQKQ